jgi:hypothetical protein
MTLPLTVTQSCPVPTKGVCYEANTCALRRRFQNCMQTQQVDIHTIYEMKSVKIRG